MGLISNIKKTFFNGTAIYVSDDFIDIAKGGLTKNGIRISFLQRFPLLKNIRNLSYMDAKDEIDKTLDKAFPNSEDKPYRVAINLKDDSFILRHFTLREIPAKELKHAIAFEAQKYVPYPVEDLVYGFKVCAKKGGFQEIIFAASEIKNLRNATEYFKTKEMLPSIIEPMPILMVRALNLQGEIEREGAYIEIHYEPSNKVIITGICHRQPHFLKEMQIFPGEDEFKTAELNYPFLNDIWSIIEGDVVGSVAYLKRETKKEVSKIFISGFSSSPEEENIAKDFGIPFKRINVSFLKCPDVTNKDRFLPVFALLHDSLSAPFLNLAPEETIRDDPWVFKPVAVKIALTFFTIIALHTVFATAISSRIKNIDAVKKNSEIYKMIDLNASREDIVRYKDIMEEKAAFINNILSNRIYVSEKLIQLSKDIAPNSWIDGLTLRNIIGEKTAATMKINGSVYGVAETGSSGANVILENIRRDENIMTGFKEVELVSVKKRKLLENEVTEFEILLK